MALSRAASSGEQWGPLLWAQDVCHQSLYIPDPSGGAAKIGDGARGRLRPSSCPAETSRASQIGMAPRRVGEGTRRTSPYGSRASTQTSTGVGQYGW
eukprot:501500-Pyramimonas_sp.AAC.1